MSAVLSALSALPWWALLLILTVLYVGPLMIGWRRSASQGRPISAEILADLLFPVLAAALGLAVLYALRGAVALLGIDLA